MTTASLGQEIASAFEEIPEVESVYVLHRGDALKVFTPVNEDNEQLSDQIYDRELELGRKRSDIHFDFNLVAKRNRPIHQFLGSYTPVWERRSCPQSPVI